MDADTEAAMRRFKRLPKAQRDYWFSEASRIRYLRVLRSWLEKTIPELEEYANGFPKTKAFVLGTGPSLERVKKAEWQALERYFTVGANQVPLWLQRNRGITKLPALNLLVDLTNPRSKLFRDIDASLRAMEGRVMVDDRSDDIHHHWQAVVFGMEPGWEIRDGLAITPMVTPVKWARTVVACAHLCALLNFRAVYLLGADHGADYHPNEPEQANPGWLAMSKFMLQRGIALRNCGAESSVVSIDTVPLGRTLA